MARLICMEISPPLSSTLSRPFCTTSARYCASTFDASALSMGATDLRASGISESSRFRAVLMTCSYRPGGSILVTLSVWVGSFFLQYNRNSRIRQAFPGKYPQRQLQGYCILPQGIYNKWDYSTRFSSEKVIGGGAISLAGVILFRYNENKAI